MYRAYMHSCGGELRRIENGLIERGWRFWEVS